MKKLTPYVWQEIDIQAILDGGLVALLNLEPGAGKTVEAMEAVLRSDARQVLVVAPLSTHESAWGRTLLRQSGEDIRVIGTKNKAQKNAYADFKLGVPGWYITTPQWFTLTSNEDWAPDTALVDECFVVGTQINTPNGPRSIEELAPGDEVYGFDHETGKPVVTRVRDTMERQTSEVMPTGATPNHPYYVVGAGYYPLADLTEEDSVYILDEENMRVVSTGVRRILEAPEHADMLPEVRGSTGSAETEEARGERVPLVSGGVHADRSAGGIVFEVVRTEAPDEEAPAPGDKTSREAERMDGQRGPGVPGRDIEPDLGRPRVSGPEQGIHDDPQPGEEPREHAEGTANEEGTRGHIRTPYGWERREEPRREEGNGATRGAVETQSRGEHGRGQQGTGTTPALQDRPGEARPQSRGGAGWKQPQLTPSAGAGREEGSSVSRAGLDDLKIREPRDRERYEQVRRRNTRSRAETVYNIETETGNYFAEGVLVHNCHMLGNPEGKGAKKLIALGGRVKYKLALSGTPARNNFERMWTIMRFLWPDNIEIARENYYGWLSEHMLYAKIFTGMKEDKFTGRKKPTYAKKYTRERKQGQLLSNAPSVIQHFRRERCCTFHPKGFLSQEEPQVLTRTVELLPAQKKAIAELEEQYLTWLDDNPLVVEIPLTLQQRVRQICLGVPTFDEDGSVNFSADMKSPVADAIEEDLELLPETEPVVIYVESQRFARALTERLVTKGYSAFEYSGATVKTRSQNLATFGREDGHRIVVGVLSAISTGTDGMQDVAKTEFWAERSTDETVNTQGEARLDRQGARGQIQRFYYADALGYASGRMNKQVTNMLALRKSLVKEV